MKLYGTNGAGAFFILIGILFAGTTYGQVADVYPDEKGYYWTDIKDFGIHG